LRRGELTAILAEVSGVRVGLEALLVLVIGCGSDGPRIGGRVHGLSRPGLVLQNNGGDDLEIGLNGPFSFATRAATGSAYDVTVLTQPPGAGQICRVAGGTGVIGDGDVTDVMIECETPGIRELSVSTPLASVDDTVTLTWASTQASSCTLDDAVLDPASIDFGTTDVTVLGATTYTLTCDTGNDAAVRNAELQVTDEDWAQVSSIGWSRTCAVKRDGRLFCWGGLGVDGGRLPVQEPTAATDWAQVAVHLLHVCAIKRDGRLFCWGAGYHGRLGTGSEDDSPAPAQEATLASDWASVAAGNVHTCAIKSDGRLFCWGWNRHGQLGNPDVVESSATPVQEASAATDWATVAAGELCTCATKTDGRLFCWGANSAGAGGTTDGLHVPTQEVTAATDWVEVSAGRYHTCALKSDGRLFCWGRNSYGQLGDGSIDDSIMPITEVIGAQDWAHVSAGREHTCAVKTDGRVFCFGTGLAGDLGNGSLAPSSVPVQEGTGATDWAQVSQSCAVKSDGRLFCWGRVDYGVDDGSLVSRTPVQEGTRSNDWAQLAVGGQASCAITRDRHLFCWGFQWPGLAADLQPLWMIASMLPVEDDAVATEWLQVAVAYSEVCAIEGSGRLFCRGDNVRGQLGNGSLEATLTLVEVATGATDWAQVTVGELHACAIKRDGRLFCWGAGDDGQLGADSLDDSPVPVQEATGATDWVEVSAGASHTCAVKSDGRLFCWGQNDFGQLGDGSVDASNTPVEESSAAEDWARVSAGTSHTCAVKVDGRLYCWGHDGNGQLGIGSLDDSPVPVEVAGQAIDWEQVACGDHHTCATRMDGQLFCWGEGISDQLGDGTTEDRLVPTAEADGVRTWTSVSAATHHTCAIREGGRIYCWGSNIWGELGIGASAAPIPPTN